jgi:hypothetical protein
MSQELMPFVDPLDNEKLRAESRRLKQNLAAEQERLRKTISGVAVVQTISVCVGKLMDGDEQRTIAGEAVRVPLSSERVMSLRAAMDGSLRLLDKLLPSLKSLEVEAPNGAVVGGGGVTYQIVTNIPRDPNQKVPVSFE